MEWAMDRPRIDAADLEQLASLVIEGLEEGEQVEVEGLGTFYPDPAHVFRFEQMRQTRVFIAHVTEDAEPAARLCDSLQEAAFSPWLDTRKLLPGQNWPRAIENAIETSDFFVACFSRNSVDKRGGFQAEVRYALDCARRMPLDDIFLAPVRFDDCRVPRSIQREVQYADLFPDWNRGVRHLTQTLRRAQRRRKR